MNSNNSRGKLRRTIVQLQNSIKLIETLPKVDYMQLKYEADIEKYLPVIHELIMSLQKIEQEE